jgi:hypothetical protein
MLKRGGNLRLTVVLNFKEFIIGLVFVIPGVHTKNVEDRLIILNEVSRSVVERQHGIHSEYVFS